MLNKFLFKQVDNTSLVVFRVFFGLLIGLEGFGAIATGWVKRTFIDPDFTFTFIGFEWLQPLPGVGMYVYFAIMGICGFLVMIGYKYRWSIGIFTVLWTCAYLMQKTSYNNHYYLLVLLCIFMWIVPAHHYLSVDAKRNPSIKKIHMPNWCLWIFILQLFIVYTYASVAKIYPDWLSGEVPKNLMGGRQNLPIIGEFLQQNWIHYLLTYVGIGFDLLVIPLLLWKRTRVFIFCCAIVFHLFNSFVLHIGIFPYMSLALCIFFFEPETIRNIFLKKKEVYTGNEIILSPYRNLAIPIFALYFISQIALPLRHWTFEGDVLWTEEGHRLSWRMMLRSKTGYVQLKIVDKSSCQIITYVNPATYTTPKQAKRVAVKPDMLWQFVQFLEAKYAEEGTEVSIYAEGRVKVNNHSYQKLFDPTVDIAAEEWLRFSHHTWLLPFKSKYEHGDFRRK
ncbi:HTTM domain-containing protein [Kordia sp. YSTF-M3]|uniref:HTTM domain-containing protein n=1 Tax=Kordia aestuariivivens TaxID=2759037 RepID=A0ABR7Q7G3_9FLAO|nr:HTTM domain-containing protein [Kordia aestuariivivens]MBC8754490.1 HTTM domain-containing protein [Kordia aestuariivivens]